MINEVMRANDRQYVTTRDDKGTWRILDKWNKVFENAALTPDTEISDDHPAVVIIREGAFIELIREATRQGLVQRMLDTIPQSDTEELKTLREELAKAKSTCDIIEEELRIVKKHLVEKQDELKLVREKADGSEGFRLKRRSIDAVLQIVGMDEIGKDRSNG